MKKGPSILKIILIAAMFIILSPMQGNSQFKIRNKTPWLSDKGFWVLQHNIKNPRRTTVYFYDNEKSLVYKEQIDGIKLNLKKKKVLMRLKNVLEQSVNTWGIQHVVMENQMLLATAFGRK